MKNELKISRLAIICVMCTAVSAAYGASSVRSLGGNGTYSSASSAAAANSGTVASAPARGGSVRITPTTGKTGTATKTTAGTTTSGRIATTPRLSIGKYLGGTTSVSGGSSLRPQGPGTSGGSSGGTMEPGTAAEIQAQVDQVRRDIDKLYDADNALSDKLLDKQDVLTAKSDGYVIIDDATNEVYVDIDGLKDELSTVVGQDGREVEIGSNADDLLWRYAGETDWQVLISKAEITGPQGIQGEKGEKGDKGEPGDAASVDLTGYAKTADIAATYAKSADVASTYATTTAMNVAIASAIAAAASNYATTEALNAVKATADSALQPGALSGYATKVDVADMATKTELATKADKSELSTLATKEELATKANVADVYTKAQTDSAIETAVDGVVAGELTGYAKTDDVNAALEAKADKTQLANYATTTDLAAKADTTTVNTLSGRVDAINTEIGEINDLATDAASAAASALTTAGSAQTTATAANTAAGEAKTAATNAATTANEAKELATAANTAATTANTTANAAKTAADAATTAVASKADKATTLAGYGITDAYTTTEIDKKLQDITVGGLEGVEEVLATKADTTYVNTQLATKANKDDLGTLAEKNQIVNADVADNAAIAKTKLAEDVQESLAKADQAVSTSDAPPSGDHVLAVHDGQKTWFEVVY